MITETIICQCGLKTSNMREMINHIEEEGNKCRSFTRMLGKTHKENKK